eukprot:m.174538 g.174538  ORF g.174538 m.174538 type:complete len:431 (+) comp17330_c0_seq5:1933-3225(+)
MGSGNSVHVQTDRQTYNAGDLVNANVYLHCASSFTCNGLALKLKGEEISHWQETETRSRTNADGSTSSETYTVTYGGTNKFFEMDVIIHNFNGTVAPGDYTFPVQFQMPATLPGSFEAESRDGGSGKIKYSALAECKVAGMLSANLRASQVITLNAINQQRALILPAAASNIAKVVCCCCCNRGQASISVRVDKNAYMPGEKVDVICDVENHSSEEFQDVRVLLLRRMTLSNGSRTHESHDYVSQQTYPMHITPNMVRTGSDALRLPLQLANQIAPSTAGKLVQCAYTITVLFHTTACCVRDVRCEVPVVIYPGRPDSLVWYDQPPPGWTPQVFPLQVINLPPPAYDTLPPGYGVVNTQPGSTSSPAYAYPPQQQQQQSAVYPPPAQQGGYPPQQAYPPQPYPPTTGGGYPPYSGDGYPSAPPAEKPLKE